MNKKAFFFLILSLLSLCVGITLLVQIPYYAMSPGEALDAGDIVQVDQPVEPDEGNFYLTTVSIKEGNVFDYFMSLITDQVELIPEKKITGGGTDEEYEKEQLQQMMTSQNKATIAAFRYLKKPIQLKFDGIEVVASVSDNGLKKGDRILKIDGIPIQSAKNLSDLLNQKQEGQVVDVELIRNNQRMVKKVKLILLPDKRNQKRVGLGILYYERQEVKTKPKVEFQSDNIGGPSAGLMFALELINQLVPEDITHGYEIAGTGTIDEDGNVGQIGGMSQKIIAADKAGVQIFFCPKDLYPGDDNEKIAKETVKKIGSEMKVVPVAHLHDAMNYLKQLKG